MSLARDYAPLPAWLLDADYGLDFAFYGADESAPVEWPEGSTFSLHLAPAGRANPAADQVHELTSQSGALAVSGHVVGIASLKAAHAAWPPGLHEVQLRRVGPDLSVEALYFGQVWLARGLSQLVALGGGDSAGIAGGQGVKIFREDGPVRILRGESAGAVALATAAAAGAAADRVATAADRVATGQDRVATGQDRAAIVQLQADIAAEHEAATQATDADRQATAADRVATGQDRVATGQDRAAIVQLQADIAAEHEAATQATAAAAAATTADRVQTGLDRAAVATDRAHVDTATAEAIDLLASASAAALALPPVEVADASRLVTETDDQTLLAFTSAADPVLVYLGALPAGFVCALMRVGEGELALISVDPALEIRTAGDGPLVTARYRTVVIRSVSATLLVLESGDDVLPADLAIDLARGDLAAASGVAALAIFA
ncbi:MAG: hypothetical protein Q8L02_04670 [Candidatus Nitrotoga sp.]|nr:hypothetical protein [Candidatus Nitrotoga sp.]